MGEAGFSLKLQSSWKDTFIFKASFNSLFHYSPNFSRIIKDGLPFILHSNFPHLITVVVAIVEHLLHISKDQIRIDCVIHKVILPFLDDLSSPY